VGLHRGKPYMIFPFVEGQHVEQPGAGHRTQLVRWAAELQKQTRGFRSPYTPYRWNYGPVLCLRLARGQAARLDTSAAYRKLAWMAHEIAALDLPPELPRGICHCDFDVSNVLFRGDELVALIDFDDANWTYLPFDLVGLVEAWAWPHTAEALDLVAARRIVRAYEQHRPLGDEEREHVYDVYKLSILFDCVWFFGRGEGEDFYEKRKIEALASLGRQGFCEALFGG
jgi:homoserine kinase type II